MSETRFYKYMKQLKAAGVVTVHKNRNGSQFAQNVYEVPRPHVSPSCRFEGMETQALVSPSSQFAGMGNEGANKTSSTKTRELTNTSITNWVAFDEQIYKLINQGKRKAGSKGRVKINGASWCIRQLVADGIKPEKIYAAAQEAAATGRDLDWFSFKDYCKGR